MKILSVTAQKPNSTGSGVYLTELVKALKEEGHEQIVMAGISKADQVELPEGVKFYPVYYESQDLPYPILGMSDEMPYKSTRYCDLTPEMVQQFENAFVKVLDQIVEKEQPDLILCHHLYLLTAIVRKHCPTIKVFGICHNTDLRQMIKTDLERAFIRENIQKLDCIFALQKAQKEQVEQVYQVSPEKIEISGTGFNNQIFCQTGEKPSHEDGVIRLAFAGKITQKKGVKSLLRALSMLPYKKEQLKLMLAGGAGNEQEYAEIRELAKTCPYPVEFLGRLSQPELAKVYNACDVFVLPSLFDGLPLTVIEAMACGERVVMTRLPGIPEWMQEVVPDAEIHYVELPRMQNADDPVEEDMPEFEKRLAHTIQETIAEGEKKAVDVSRVSWARIAQEIINRY